jgi:hypothetical protein
MPHIGQQAICTRCQKPIVYRPATPWERKFDDVAPVVGWADTTPTAPFYCPRTEIGGPDEAHTIEETDR